MLNLLRESINKNRTAIIVTHNINLATKYADKIIVISEHKNDKQNSYGEIKKQNVFKYYKTIDEKRVFVDFEGKTIDNIQEKVRYIMGNINS